MSSFALLLLFFFQFQSFLRAPREAQTSAGLETPAARAREQRRSRSIAQVHEPQLHCKTPRGLNSRSPVHVKHERFLPGSRSSLSGNWRRRKRAPHLTAKRSPPSSREWEPRSAWAAVLRVGSRCSDTDLPVGGTYCYTTVTKSIW